MKEYTNIIDDIIPKWNEKEIENGKTFNQIFQIEGIPLWWFYKRFLLNYVLPKYLNKENKNENKIIKWTFSKSTQFNSFIQRKYLRVNEKIKQKFAKNSEKNIKNEEKILFLSYTTHFDKKTKKNFRIQKIIDQLNEDKKIMPFVIFADPLSKRSYHKISSLDNSIYCYIDSKLEKSAQRIAKEFSEKWKKLNKEKIFGSFWGSIKLKMNFFFSFEFIYHTALYYLTCKKIIKEEKIKLIVLTAQNSIFEKSFIAAAKNLETKLISIQHGIGLGINNPNTFPGMKYAVFGQFYQQRLIDKGVNPADIIITGPIIFDGIINFKNKKNNSILIVSDPCVTQNLVSKKDYFNLILKTIKSLEGITDQIILKLHPRDLKKEEFENLFQKNNIKNIKIVDKMGNDHLYPLINDSKLVINFFSSVALEAILLDKPILSINLGIYQYNLDEYPHVGGLIIKKDDDFKKAILKALQNPEEIKNKRKKVAEYFCDKVDGKSYLRVVEAIYQLIDLQK